MELDIILLIVTEIIGLVLYSALFILSLVLYFGRQGYNLFHPITCFRLAGKMSRNTKQDIRSRIPLFVLTNMLSLFLLYRAFHSAVQIIHASVFEFMPLRIVATIVDYFGFLLFIPLFSTVVLVWFRVSMAWESSSTSAKVFRYTVYAVLVVCNVTSLLLAISVSVVQAFRMQVGEHVMGIVQNYVAVSIVMAILLVLTAMTVVMTVRVIVMLRRSARYHHGSIIKSSGRFTVESGIMLKQRIAMFKCIFAAIVVNIALVVRTFGFVLLALNVPYWISLPLCRNLPEYLSTLAVIFVFWPFYMPTWMANMCMAKSGRGMAFLDPIQFVQNLVEEADTKLDKAMGRQQSSLSSSSPSTLMAQDESQKDKPEACEMKDFTEPGVDTVDNNIQQEDRDGSIEQPHNPSGIVVGSA